MNKGKRKYIAIENEPNHNFNYQFSLMFTINKSHRFYFYSNDNIFI
jgi:hypothetical protein